MEKTWGEIARELTVILGNYDRPIKEREAAAVQLELIGRCLEGVCEQIELNASKKHVLRWLAKLPEAQAA